MRRIELYFASFGWESLEAKAAEEDWTLDELVLVASYYFARRINGRFVRSLPQGASLEGKEARVIELAVSEDVWDNLEREAERQGLPTHRLLEHAALVYLADDEAGIAAQMTPIGALAESEESSQEPAEKL